MSEIINLSSFQKIMSTVSTFLTVMLIVVMVGVVIILMLDLLKAVSSGDPDATKKALNVAKSRLITLVIFLFVPILTSVVLNLIGADGYKFSTNNEKTESELGESYGKIDVLDGYIDFSMYVKVDDSDG